MTYRYDMTLIIKNPKIYIEETIDADTFHEALHTLIERNKLFSYVFLVYVKSKSSGNLVLMGFYDGMSVINAYGSQYSHILRTKEDKDYIYYPGEFKRVYIK